MRRSGGRRRRRWRSAGGVSPVRRPTSGRWTSTPDALGGELDAEERGAEVLLDVDGEGPQRGEVEDAGALGAVRHLGRHDLVDAPQERGEGLPRAGGGEDQAVVTVGDGGPALLLGRGGRGEGRLEPLPYDWCEPIETCHGLSLRRGCDSDARAGVCPCRVPGGSAL